MVEPVTHRLLGTLRDEGVGTRELVSGAALVLVLAQLAWRAWIVVPGWFYADDLLLLEDATRPLQSVLLEPNDSQLMPLGRVVAALVAAAGPYAWWAAATSVLVLSAAATAACWLMLRTVFGPRPFVLVPFALFCFLPLAADASSWWAVALNALPAQVAFFLVVTGFVLWSRERRPRWAVLVVLAYLLGAASGPRALLMALPVGAFVVLFCSGTGRGTLGRVARRHGPVVAPLAALGVAYLVLYRATTPPPVQVTGATPWIDVADRLLLSSVLPGLVGGPWRWDVAADPLSVPDPTLAVRVVAVVAVMAVVAVAWRRRPSTTWRAVVVVLVQVAGTYVAIALGRGLQVGAVAGQFTRYLPDLAAVLPLALAAAVLPVRVPDAPSVRERVLLPRLPSVPRAALGAALAAVLVASLVNAAAYARPWHEDFPARRYVENARASLLADPRPVADLEVPELVQLGLHYPRNLPSHVLAPYGDLVDARRQGNDLAVLDTDGTARQPLVRGAESAPGPVAGCGTKVVPGEPGRIALDRAQMPDFPWTTINYAASVDGEAVLRFDGREPVRMQVLSGPHTYLVNGDGAYSTLEVDVTTPGLTVCVDRVAAGTLEALR